MAPFNISYTTYYQYAIVTIVLPCTISEIKRDIGRKSRFFHSPAFDVPAKGVAVPSEHCHNVWSSKTRLVWLPNGEKDV